jgi:multicomponent Na+:H+ antiporter subunit B
MSERVRLVVFVTGASCVAALLVLAFFGMPHFGSGYHPYRDHSVAAAAQHSTANVVSSINYDQRALDTLGEETILLGAVIGAATLLRPAKREERERMPSDGRILESTELFGYLFLPLTLIVGADLIVHGHLTPGGGFQGGVVLSTGLHLLYVAGRYPALDRIRPLNVFEDGEAFGAGAFAVIGLAGIPIAGSYLANIIPTGRFGTLISAGTVDVLSIAVGVAVGAGSVVLLATFLEQALVIGPHEATKENAQDKDAHEHR